MALLAIPSLIFIYKLNVERPHGSSTLDNKPIIITFLAMEKVFLLFVKLKHRISHVCSQA